MYQSILTTKGQSITMKRGPTETSSAQHLSNNGDVCLAYDGTSSPRRCRLVHISMLESGMIYHGRAIQATRAPALRPKWGFVLNIIALVA